MERNKERDLVSVIVPIYNTQLYLGHCLDSISRQTYKNLEIILVDDASTDESGRLCDEWVKKDVRMVCIHQKSNKGLAASRNTGVRKAKGQYVVFVDSDDEIECNMIEILYEAIEEYKVPIVRCGIRRVNRLGGLTESGIHKKTIKYEITEGWQYLIKYDWTSSCCGMYHIELARKMKFPEGHIYEDFYLLPRILCEQKKVLYLQHAGLYHYYVRSGSITQTARQTGVNADMSLVLLINLAYFRKHYGKESKIFLMMEEFYFRRIVREYLYAGKGNNDFMVYYRKCVTDNLYTILFNQYIGWRLKLAILHIFCFPKDAAAVLNVDEILNQQTNIKKKKEEDYT